MSNVGEIVSDFAGMFRTKYVFTPSSGDTNVGLARLQGFSLVRYVILAIYVAKIDFIVFMASLGVK